MAKSTGSEGLVNHYHTVRLRLTGAGNLQMTMYSLDEINSLLLVDLVMTATAAIEPLRLSNFKTQRMSLELKTTEIDERMKVSKIVIYVKPVETGFPG